MAENCSGTCGSCSENCAEREEQQTNFRERTHEMSHIKKVIAIVSGKGGVGKSSVTSMLAVSMRRLGYRVAILDADITGPSIPKAFGITEKAAGSDIGIFPIISKTGIRLMSINLLLENATCSGIKQDTAVGCFYVNTKPVLTFQRLGNARVFRKDCQFHASIPPACA